MFLRYAMAVVALAFLVDAARAQDDEPLFTKISEKTLQKVFDDSKFEWERRETESKGKKSVLYLLTLNNGLKATIMTHSDSLSIMSLGFRGADKEDITLERINAWNVKYGFYAVGWIDDKGLGVLGARLDMRGGTNQKIIGVWLKSFAFSLNDFERFTR